MYHERGIGDAEIHLLFAETGSSFTYMRDECIPLLLSYKILQVVQEGRSFFIGDARESIVGVLPLQVNNELRKFVIGSEMSY